MIGEKMTEMKTDMVIKKNKVWDEDEYREKKYDEHLRRNSCDRYLPVFGPNSKQWWVYDECEDVYIDPPKVVLDRMYDLSMMIFTMGTGLSFHEIEQVLLAEEILKVMRSKDSWLEDKEYWYKELEI